MKQPSLLTLLMAVVFSCSGKYEGTTINIPEKMIKIEKGAVSEYEYKPTGKPTLIIYYGQDECSVCVSETLEDKYKECILHSKETGRYDVMIIMCPQDEEREMVSYIIEKRSFPFPVFLASDNLFEEAMNKNKASILDENGTLRYYSVAYHKNIVLKRINRLLS